MTEPSDHRLLLQQAFQEIQRLRRELAGQRAPVAVIGLGCRFPGAAGPRAFWALLAAGRDAIGEVPAGRWDPGPWYDPDPEAPGRIATRRGGFLEAVDGFDADFFGLSPREAERMDPQQRLLLEVVWEALEHARLPADRLRGGATGVFIGQCFDDYARLSTFGPDPRRMDGLAALGSARSVTAGRLAYLLDLKGPALCLDTACSSSLLAVHLAVQSLRAGECRTALAGGVNLLLGPESFVGLSRLQALAPDGRCKSFDAAADGYGRGEGCGVVVLKRLADAQADGDTVLAVIRGTAVNHDGASNGLTAPNGQAQEALLRTALADAGLGPADIHYVETHGTGTALGDPIEALALARVLGEGRAEPLWLGSVKSNIGHLEAAAGVAGLIKTVLALGRDRLPPSLHFTTPNPHIPWARLPLRVVDRARPWPGAPRRAGISSFGMSGTNVHVIVEQAPPAPTGAGAGVPPPWLLPLSARDPAALAALAAAYGEVLEGAGPADLCRAAATGRAHLETRATVAAADGAGLRAGLEALAAGRIAPEAHARPPRLAWLCTGQGAQYPGMGRGLYRDQPEFRAAIDRCAAILDPLLGRSLTGLLFGDGEAVHATAHTQPALFALEYALARTWRAWGVEPAAVMGHSVGQYVAACLAGVFSLEDGLRLIAARGRLIQSLPQDGGMAAVQAPAEALAGVLERHPQLAVAALNGPVNTVLSGALTALEAALAELERMGVGHRRLDVSHAFHSPLLDPILEDFARAAATVEFHPPALPLICNLSGEPAGAEVCDPDYWARHLRRPVRFAAGVAALAGLGCDTFLEIGPRPTLAALGRQCLERGLWLASLDPRREDRAALLDSLAALYRRGQSVDWRGVYGHAPGRPVDLPTYPWQRRRHWLEPPRGGLPARGETGHPLLGRRLDTGPALFESRLDPRRPAWLGQHRLDGRPLLGAAAVLELLLAAGRNVPGGDELAVVDLRLEKPLPLAAETTVQLALHPAAGGWEAQLYRLDGDWTRHARARLIPRAGPAPAPDLAELRARCPRPLDPAELGAALAALGLDPPPGIEALWQGEGQSLARLRGEAGDWLLNPPLLEAAIVAAAAALPAAARGRAWRTAGLEGLTLWRRPGETGWCHARAEARDGAVRLHLALLDESGPLAELTGLELRPGSGAALLPGLYGLEWETVAASPLADTVRPPVPAADPALDDYARDLARLEDLALDYALAALGELGWAPAPGERVTATGLAKRLGVIPRHRDLCGRLLALLGEAGIARAEGDGWRVLSSLPAAAPTDHPPTGAAAAERALLDRCGPRLAAVLRGEQDPLDLLFPGGDPHSLTRLYRDSPSARAMNALAARALAAALPAGGRVLEVGAGTGATSAALMEALPGDSEYWLTDLSPLFLNRARERFAHDPRLRTAVLDLERDPAEQGFGRRRFHAVVAANVVHACRDLRAVLDRLHRLLVPGGLLLLVEGTARRRWLDLTFGLSEGWWRFTDRDLRPDHALLPAAAWRELLASRGFEQAAAIAPPTPPAFQQCLLLARRSAGQGRWLLLADRGGVAEALARELGADHCRLVYADPKTAGPGGLRPWLDDAPPDGIVHLWSLDSPDPEPLDAAALMALAARDCGGALHLVQALLAGNRRPTLWLVTRGARGVGGETRLSPAQAALWGLGETLQGEHPELACRLLDLDPGGEADEARLLARQLAGPGEDRLARRGGAWRAPRLTPLTATGGDLPPPRTDGRYAITGGLGGLGLALASWLAERGARHLLLIGRHADPQRPPEAVRALRDRGVTVTLAAADVADPAALARALDLDGGPPLRGVIHAAGVFADRRLAEHRWELFEQVLAPKLAGAWNLHRLTRGLALDCFVLCSSAAALLGAPGLANYVAANACLDGLAGHRRRLGLPALAVDWSPWAGLGMAAAVGGRREGQWAALGLRPLAAEQALAALERLLAQDVEQAGVLDMDWGRFLAGFPDGPPALFARLRPARAIGPALATDPAAALRAADPARRRALAQDWVREQLAAILGFAGPAAVPAQRGFFQMGLDSLTAMDLHKRVGALIGREPPATLSFKYPTVAALGEWLAEALAPAAEPGAAPGAAPDALAAELAELEQLLGGDGGAA